MHRRGRRRRLHPERRTHRPHDAGGGYVQKILKRDRRCMICPPRETQRPCRVKSHLLNYHVGRTIWRASGRERLRRCNALSGNDSFDAHVGGVFIPQPNYLRRSAEIIRAHVLTDSPDSAVEMAPSNLIDRQIRLIQYAGCP